MSQHGCPPLEEHNPNEFPHTSYPALTDYGSSLDSDNGPSKAYKDLDRGSIRLLRLLPGEDGQRVCCEISEHPLTDVLSYNAISYAWGAGPPQHHIMVSGHDFAVRKNIWRFLCQARKSTKMRDRLFWIDALCIDQSNNAERTHQVGLMAEIFSRANRVIVWLGPSYGDSDVAMEKLRKGSSYWSTNNRMATLWAKPYAAGLVGLCVRPYWRRLWVFQELALAKRAIVMCGHKVVPYESVEYFLALAQATQPRLRAAERIEHNTFIGSPALLMAQEKQALPYKTPLWDLIFATQALRCAEPRDKIYALLGVASRGGESINADYDLPIPDLLNRVVAQHHAEQPPESLAEVEHQCRELGALFGDELLLYSLVYEASSLEATERAIFNLEIEESLITPRWAHHYGHHPVTEMLIRCGTIDHEFSLPRAVKAGSLDTVQLLLAIGAVDVNALFEGRTPLMLAIQSRCHALVEHLLSSAKTDVNLSDERGFPPIVVAAHFDDEKSMRLLIETERVNFDKLDTEGHTPLEWATIKGHDLAVRMFSEACNNRNTHTFWQTLEQSVQGHMNEALDFALLRVYREHCEQDTQTMPMLRSTIAYRNDEALALLLRYLPYDENFPTETHRVLSELLLDAAIGANDMRSLEILLQSRRLAPGKSELSSEWDVMSDTKTHVFDPKPPSQRTRYESKLKRAKTLLGPDRYRVPHADSHDRSADEVGHIEQSYVSANAAVATGSALRLASSQEHGAIAIENALGTRSERSQEMDCSVSSLEPASPDDYDLDQVMGFHFEKDLSWSTF